MKPSYNTMVLTYTVMDTVRVSLRFSELPEQTADAGEQFTEII